MAIVSKDVLEQLLIEGGIEYVNIFPEGRRIIGLPILMGTAINFLRTLWRLLKLVKGRKYNVFITDDVLAVVGRIKGVPTLMFTDDDIDVVPESRLLLASASKILAPEITEIGKYQRKKIALKGFKEVAYLSPSYFTPSEKVLQRFNPGLKPYAIVRLVSLTASHDIGKNGIGDIRLKQLVELLEKKMCVFITSERALPKEWEKYRLTLPVHEIAHALFYAQLYVGDSQTMASEAAILGTPVVRFNDFVGKIRSMEIKQEKYGLMPGFTTNHFDDMLNTIEEMLKQPNLKAHWQDKAQQLLNDCEDVNEAIRKAILNTAALKR